MIKAKQFIAVTRARIDANELCQLLSREGYDYYKFPTISFKKVTLNKEEKLIVNNLAQFDYIIFTSAHAVVFFAKYFAKNITLPKIVAVGPHTKEVCVELGVSSVLLNTRYSKEGIVAGLKNIKGKKILLPQSKITDGILAQALRKKGAEVIPLYHYTTETVSKRDKYLEHLIQVKRIKAISFMSPSSVAGFFQRLPFTLHRTAREVPVVAIGLTTREACKKEGFLKILTSKTSTAKGVVATLRKIK